MIERVQVIVNTDSGTGCAPSLPGRLLGELLGACPGVGDVELAVVADHASARHAARAFVAASTGPAAVIAGGGGGTLRAAVEGIYDARAEGRVVVGALRMGSGNVIARHLGVRADPLEGMRQLARALRECRLAGVPVVRCAFGEGVRHAVVMCGFGQWGRTSGDLARWHRAAPRRRAALAAVTGIERVNHAEYLVAAGVRLLEAAVSPRACELVEVSCQGSVERFRLLAGAVVASRVPGLPLRPGVVMVPRGGRPRRFRLQAGDSLDITLLDRDAVEFFVDEDPEVARGSIRVELAGTLRFLAAEVAS